MDKIVQGEFSFVSPHKSEEVPKRKQKTLNQKNIYFSI